MRYKTIIHIECRSIEDLFRLPCVYSITKVVATKHLTDSPIEITLMDLNHAYVGDYLCEDEDGRWVVEKDVENLDK